MIEFLCYGIIWILALYGFIEILKELIYFFIKSPNVNLKGIHMVIGIKNSEDTVEPFVRTLFFKILNSKYNNLKIIIVDMNSTDNTRKILVNLQKDYNFELQELNYKFDRNDN